MGWTGRFSRIGLLVPGFQGQSPYPSNATIPLNSNARWFWSIGFTMQALRLLIDGDRRSAARKENARIELSQNGRLGSKPAGLTYRQSRLLSPCERSKSIRLTGPPPNSASCYGLPTPITIIPGDQSRNGLEQSASNRTQISCSRI